MKTLQEKIFDSILSRFEKKSDAVAKLSSLINVGKDAVYRRLRGDTILTPDEITLLAQEFNLSLDGLIHDQSHLVFFSFNPFANRLKSFDDYLDSTIKDLSVIAGRSDGKLLYASSEIPIFLIGFFPELISFNLYIWGKTAFSFDYLNDIPFSFDIIPPSAKEKYSDLVDLYLKVPSTELWGLDLIGNTLKQIETYTLSDKFANAEIPFVLLDRLADLFTHIKKMAKHGKKFKPYSEPTVHSADYELYHNEMIYMKNTVIGQTPNGLGVYSSFGNPNYLKSFDPNVTTYIFDWFEKIKAKSNPMGLIEERNLDKVFNRIQKKIENTRAKVSVHLDTDLD